MLLFVLGEEIVSQHYSTAEHIGVMTFFIHNFIYNEMVYYNIVDLDFGPKLFEVCSLYLLCFMSLKYLRHAITLEHLYKYL